MSAGELRAFAYLHGFASGPLATKGRALAQQFEARGLELQRPDLNCPSFGRLTVTAMLARMDALDAQLRARHELAPRWSFVGSSMGAWVGALWSAANPARVDAAVWLAPGFYLAQRWPAMMGAAAFAAWEVAGEIPIPDGSGTPVPVHFGLVSDARLHAPAPTPVVPTRIIHGTRDTIVPVDISRTYLAQHQDSGVALGLTEVDDDHRLHSSGELIWAQVSEHLDLGAPPAQR